MTNFDFVFDLDGCKKSLQNNIYYNDFLYLTKLLVNDKYADKSYVLFFKAFVSSQLLCTKISFPINLKFYFVSLEMEKYECSFYCIL